MTSGPALSIIVPTFNEKDNVPILIERLRAGLAGIAWEAVIVDDNSPDGTSGVARALAAEDARIRCIRRVGRRGLSGACVEGMLAASAPVVAVIDADLQHDEALLPAMFAAVQSGADLVIGTRYADGGSTGAGLSAFRHGASRFATSLARNLLGVTVSDPMSGFFMLRRAIVEDAAPKLSEQGYKILLDILASSPKSLKIVELPYTFRERTKGESKLDSLVALDYFGLLAAKTFGDWVSVRFLMFVLVGFSGLVVHLIMLQTLLVGKFAGFYVAQTAATYVAMVWNFFVNNQLTYRDRRLKGWAALRGLVIFCAVCSVGAFANIGVARWIFFSNRTTAFIAGTAGALMGAVYNYAATAALTWRKT